MDAVRSIYRRFSARPGNDEEDADDNVDNLWPSIEESRMAQRRGVVGLAAAKENEEDIPVKPSKRRTKSSLSLPIPIPDIKRDADVLMETFIQSCVRLAVGKQIQRKVLETAQEKLDAAVAFHDILHKDFLELSKAVSRISTLRPWYRSEKFLAETRLKRGVCHRPVKTKTRGKDLDDDFQFALLDLRAIVTRFDEGTSKVRSFELVSREDDQDVTAEPWSRPTWDHTDNGILFDPAPPPNLGRRRSLTSLRNFLRDELESIPSDLDSDDEDDMLSSGRPSEADESGCGCKLHTKLCTHLIDPRRSSISSTNRAAIIKAIRKRQDPVSRQWEKIRYAQADHKLSEKDDTSKVEFCMHMLQAITEVELEFEVHKEATREERNRAQLLVLRLQWNLNNPQGLKRGIEAKQGKERQKQMGMWEALICAAALRESPEMPEKNLFGSIICDSPDPDMGVVLPHAQREAEDPEDLSESDILSPEESETELFESDEVDVQLGRMRMDSGAPATGEEEG